MTEKDFQDYINKHAKELEEMRAEAHQVHDKVNQTYAQIHPYGFHLDMVADSVRRYGHWVCVQEEDVLPLFFGAYFHDSIEDARLTYNKVEQMAQRWMNEQQAYMAAEIVYALTNDKGRTRTERAGEKYYQGIRETPYAPFVKLADRLANFTCSFTHTDTMNTRLKRQYQQELPHFLEAIDAHSDDPRFALPAVMVKKISQICPIGNITLSNDVQEVPQLAQFIEEMCEAKELDMATTMNINLAMEEAVVNVMNYAYPAGTKGPIDIEAQADDETISFTIIDCGKPFDPTTKEEVDTTLTAEERSIGGLGIHLIRQLMDSITYERADNRNILTLRKNITHS